MKISLLKSIGDKREKAMQKLGIYDTEDLVRYYPRPYLDTEKNVQCQTLYMQNAAYLRVKNLQIGYTIPMKHASQAMLQNARIYFSGENLLTFTPMTKLFDPETIGENETGNVYPLSRTYAFGVSLTF